MRSVLICLSVLHVGCFLRIEVSKTTFPPSQSTETTTLLAMGIPTTTIPPSTTTINTLNITQVNNISATEAHLNRTLKPLPNETQAVVSILLLNHERNKFRHSVNYYCKCDLKINFCDVNCCCDVDCNNQMLMAFDCNLEESHSYILNHGLPSCSVSSSLFCVLKNNFIDEAVTDFDIRLMSEKTTQKWPNKWPDSLKTNYSETYRFNDEILFYNELTESVDTLVVPNCLFGKSVFFAEPLKFMADKASSCEKKVTVSYIENILANVTFIKVLSSPASNILVMETCVPCIPLEPFICSNASISERDCEIFNSTDQWPDFKDIEFEIVHNYSHIRNFKLFFHSNDEEEETNQETQVQRFSVNFHAQTAENLLVYSASGNMGYQSSKPVIITRFIEVNVSESETTQLIEFFKSTKSSQHFFQLPQSNNKGCKAGPHRSTLNFGENLLQTCDLLMPEIVTDKSNNITVICSSYQKEIFKALTGNSDLTTVYVSAFGNPQNSTKSWIKMPFGFDFTQITGEVTDEKLFCRNMAIDLRLSFYFARLKVAPGSGVHLQSIIKRAQLDVGTAVDLQFNLKEDIQIPISISVMFFDLTAREKSSGRSNMPISGLIIVLLGSMI